MSFAFAALRRDVDVVGHRAGVKCQHHPEQEPIALEFSTFAVKGQQQDRVMMIDNPATPERAASMKAFLASRA